MARIIHTSLIDSNPELLADPNLRLWVYNGLDCVATKGVANAILPDVKEKAGVSYDFVRAMQAPALEMMTRGVPIQPKVRADEAKRLSHESARLRNLLDELATAIWGRGLNPDSNKEMLAFFYTALNMPVQYTLRKTPEGKKKTPSCDHKALEALAKLQSKGPGVSPYDRKYTKLPLARPFVALVLGIRDVSKRLGVVNSRLSPDQRWRCSYNVVGTVTGRWSASKNAFNEGTNFQNITEEMRRMVCAEDGYKLGAPDLEQAESRLVAGLTWLATGDDTYWRACESGDLHTIVCVMAYPERFVDEKGASLGHWSSHEGRFLGDLKACRVIADRKFYRHLSMRDLAKRIGHGSNYFGVPVGIAQAIGIPTEVVAEFQKRYFAAFPAIRLWHEYTIRVLQTTSTLVTPLGRIRTFFKRTDETSTLNEAIAHVPQSTIGELLNLMLYRVWEWGARGNKLGRNGSAMPWSKACQILLQVHDSIVFMYPAHLEDQVIAKVAELMTISLPLTRTHEDGTTETKLLALPLEFKTGWNWARQDKELFPDENPDGLTKYRGPGSEQRTRTTGAKPALHEWLN